VEVSLDEVIIEGIKVPRPPYVAHSEWINFWQAVAVMNEDEYGFGEN
jgi:hypothetical protein